MCSLVRAASEKAVLTTDKKCFMRHARYHVSQRTTRADTLLKITRPAQRCTGTHPFETTDRPLSYGAKIIVIKFRHLLRETSAAWRGVTLTSGNSCIIFYTYIFYTYIFYLLYRVPLLKIIVEKIKGYSRNISSREVSKLKLCRSHITSDTHSAAVAESETFLPMTVQRRGNCTANFRLMRRH